MSKLRKIIAGCMLSVVALSSTAFASEIGVNHNTRTSISSARYTEWSRESGRRVLEEHQHFLHANSIQGSGIAYARKVMDWAPDLNVAHVSLPGSGARGSANFMSSLYTATGSHQLYYTYFSPTPGAIFDISIADTRYY